MNKKFKLPKEFAEKWIKALESGEYKQNAGSLYQENWGYCCLGVAGVVCGIEQNVMEEEGTFLIIKKLAKEHNVPDILLERGDNILNLVGILVNLNDNSLNTEERIRAEQEQGLIFPKKDVSAYDFKDIAEFIKLNVEFV